MGKDETVKRDEPGPDEAYRWGIATPDDEDTEAHRKPVPREGGPDEAVRPKAAKKDDPEAPGPDGLVTKGWSDRNVKVEIVPVEW